MDDKDKRELAKLLGPHLAWDLARVELFNYEPHPDATATGGEVFIQQIVMQLRGRMARGETFTIAIIPVGTDLPKFAR